MTMSASPGREWDVRVHQLRQTPAFFAAALIVATRPLWWVDEAYPQIPWFGFARHWPLWVDRLSLGVTAILLTTAFVPREKGSDRLLKNVGHAIRARWKRAPRISQAAATRWLWLGPALLILSDQHRLQPWAWQMVWTAALLAAADKRLALTCVRAFIISIYFWSAISKLDAAFLTGRGVWMLDGLLGSVGLSTAMWTDAHRFYAAAAFPLGELLVAALLSFRRTRRLGVIGSAGMHGLLLLALGPWGHDQKWGVLLWNIYFIVQNLLLFSPVSAASPSSQPAEVGTIARSREAVSTRGAVAASVLLIALPGLEPFGLFDHWPAWSVYSARPAMVPIYVREHRLGDLPPSLRPFVGPPAPLTDWRPINLDAWSFAVRHCPPYPQLRYRLAVARSLAERGRLGPDIRVVILSPPDRWTGERTREELVGQAAIEEKCSAFLLNTRPHSRWPGERGDVVPASEGRESPDDAFTNPDDSPQSHGVTEEVTKFR